MPSTATSLPACLLHAGSGALRHRQRALSVTQLEYDELPSLPLVEVAGIANRPATAGENRPRSAIASGQL